MGESSRQTVEQTDVQPCDFSVILESILSNFAICLGGSDGSAELICRLLALLRLYRTSFLEQDAGPVVQPTAAERRVHTGTWFPALYHLSQGETRPKHSRMKALVAHGV